MPRARYERVLEKYEQVRREIHRLEHSGVAATPALEHLAGGQGEAPAKNGLRLADLLRRPRLCYADLAPLDPERPDLPRTVTEQVEISLKYEGYIARQQRQVEEMRRLEGKVLPSDLDYQTLAGLRLEARQKLTPPKPPSPLQKKSWHTPPPPKYFRQTYGAQVCLPQLEADIVRSEESLKNHLFNFTMGMIRTVPRLKNLVCPVDRVIGLRETEIDFCGVKLGIVRTPGHSPDHICVVTPDNVCFAGDALMTEDVLKDAMVPLRLRHGRRPEEQGDHGRVNLRRLYLLPQGRGLGLRGGAGPEERRPHPGPAGSLRRPGERAYDLQPVLCRRGHRHGPPVGHPARGLHLERYIRPYAEYLIDTGALTLIERNGAPAVAPKEAGYGK